MRDAGAAKIEPPGCCRNGFDSWEAPSWPWKQHDVSGGAPGWRQSELVAFNVSNGISHRLIAKNLRKASAPATATSASGRT